MENIYKIYALSDATGELANHLAHSAVRQFQSQSAEIVRVPKVKSVNSLEEYVKQAKSDNAIIIFTFVSNDMRAAILKLSQKYEVKSVDVLGPILGALSDYFREVPSTEPGLQYKMNQQYFKRTEALEYTVKHDDGLGVDTIVEADVILLGVSRTSKTPLSIYLAYNGFRCANIPIVKGIPLPAALEKFDRKRMIGLTISPEKLSTIRSARLKKLGRSREESYAQIMHVKEELAYAQKLFRDLGIMVIEVTTKAIEETASEIVNRLKL